MNHCTNCGAAIADDDLVIWRCQECGKKYKIKMSKIREMQTLKNRPENTGKSILRCRECGIDMDNGIEELSFKCKECGEVIKGNLRFFALDDDVDMEPTWDEETEKEEAVPVNNENTITCPECGEMISDTVDICPECGYPIKEEVKKLFFEQSKINIPENSKTVKDRQNQEELSQQNKLKSIKKEHKEYKNKTNNVGQVFSLIGWCVIIFGTLFESMKTIINYNETYSSADRTMIITTFIVIEAAIVISGLIPIGFAEIIFLLENIRDKLHDAND